MKSKSYLSLLLLNDYIRYVITFSNIFRCVSVIVLTSMTLSGLQDHRVQQPCDMDEHHPEMPNQGMDMSAAMEDCPMSELPIRPDCDRDMTAICDCKAEVHTPSALLNPAPKVFSPPGVTSVHPRIFTSVSDPPAKAFRLLNSYSSPPLFLTHESFLI